MSARKRSSIRSLTASATRAGRRFRRALGRSSVRWRLVAAGLALSGLGLIATCQFLGDEERASAGAGPTPEINVLLTRANRLELRIDGAYSVRNSADQVVGKGERLSRGLLVPSGSGLALNGRQFGNTQLLFRPEADVTISIDGKQYPGTVSVRRAGAGLEVVNHVDMETYVAGVLFSEMPRSFGNEALKAQAVAARSYARWRLKNGHSLILPTQADQVYAGRGPLHRAASEIVDQTRGEVLEWKGEAFCTYYSSTCGGGTSPVEKVFTGAAHGAMRGTKCNYCKSSPRYRWQRRLPLRDLAACFGLADGQQINEVAQQVDAAGRAHKVELRGRGFRKSISGQDFRARWNAVASAEQQLPAFLFHQIRIEAGQLVIDGGGFGHGVGLCQYGCKGLAAAGLDYREILNHYYRGAEVVRRW